MARKLTKKEMEALYEYTQLILDTNHSVYDGEVSQFGCCKASDSFEETNAFNEEIVHYI